MERAPRRAEEAKRKRSNKNGNVGWWAEDSDQAPGVRPRGHRPIDEEDRRDGHPYSGEGARSGPAADRDPQVLRDPLPAQAQGLPRALRDADPQASARHRRTDGQDRGVVAAPRP